MTADEWVEQVLREVSDVDTMTDACPVRVVDGEPYVMHGCGAEVERLGHPVQD